MQVSHNGKPALGNTNGINVVTKKITSSNYSAFNKVAKSVSQSKPPAHAQYFNSAKVKNESATGG